MQTTQDDLLKLLLVSVWALCGLSNSDMYFWVFTRTIDYPQRKAQARHDNRSVVFILPLAMRVM